MTKRSAAFTVLRWRYEGASAKVEILLESSGEAGTEVVILPSSLCNRLDVKVGSVLKIEVESE
jgi:hypothetical protein